MNLLIELTTAVETILHNSMWCVEWYWCDSSMVPGILEQQQS